MEQVTGSEARDFWAVVGCFGVIGAGMFVLSVSTIVVVLGWLGAV